MKMKNLMVALFAAGCAPAFAQSSVSLYGVIDEGINYTNNVGGKHVVEMQSGYAQGDRWGLRGNEDLGDGTSAIFRLESGFNINNGAAGWGGLAFGEQAYVGIKNNTYGTLTVGRQWDAVVDYVSSATAGDWAGWMFAHPYDNDNTGMSFHVNNAIKYTSPTLAGFQFGGTYSLSNATSFADNRAFSLGGQYTNGGLLVTAGYLQADNPSATANGAISNAADENFVAQRLRILGAGINYTFGAATAGFVYTNTALDQPQSTSYISGSITPANGTLNTLRFQNFEANLMYRFTPSFSAGAQYVYTIESFHASSGSATPKVQSIGLMADYNLSKRTDIYVQGAYQHVGGDKTGTALDMADIPGADNASSTSSQIITRLAIRHKF